MVPFSALTHLSLCFHGNAPLPETSRLAALVAAPWFARLHTLSLSGCNLGTHGGSDGVGLRALAAAPLPNLASLNLNSACLSAANLPGVLSRD